MRKRKNDRRNFRIRFLAFIMIVSLGFTVFSPISGTAYAEEETNVYVKYDYTGARFSFYYIGVVDDSGDYQISDQFAAYDVNMTSADAASTLASYIRRDGIEPTQTAETDLNKIASFDSLEDGVYLVLSDPFEDGDSIYISTPVLLVLPYVDEDGNTVLDFTMQAKNEKYKSSNLLTVRKVWKSDNEDERPESVTVQLLCDGVLADLEDAEQVLDADTNWSYTWSDISAGHIWTTVEKDVPDGYIVSNSTDDDETVITNTSEVPYTPGSSGGSGGTTKNTLPYTGQYWIPVLGMVTAGLFLILIGLLRRARKS